MARWKKTPEETKAKVVELKMQNPELSSHDIEEQLLWTDYECSHDTISRILDDLRQLATTERWKKQLDRLEWIVDDIEEVTTKVLKSIKDKQDLTIRDIKDLTDISKTNWERMRLLQDKSTSNVNILWDVLSELQWLKENN